MHSIIENSFVKLKNYCEKEDFMGWDPYDGLNSKVFQALPGIRNSKFCRLAWIQTFKRNPVNLRRLFLVQKDYNPKGLGLFLNGYCNLYRIETKDVYLEKIHILANKILDLKSHGYSGACWGYNFNWESRAFFQPKYTPTIVASVFIGYALMDAYDITGNDRYLQEALSVTGFILKDLNRTFDSKNNFCFSYSPGDTSQVFNATLLGSRLLARAYHYTKDKLLLVEAKKSIDYCINYQKEDGSWSYGMLPFHQWIDNFHTGYNLECLSEYQRYSGDISYQSTIDIGFEYYMNTFFLADGRCKYYNNSLYPIDIHAAAEAVIIFSRLGLRYRDLNNKVIRWMISHLQDEKGFFYFQKHKFYGIRIPYIRWAQAWAFHALISYLTSDERQKN